MTVTTKRPGFLYEIAGVMLYASSLLEAKIQFNKGV